MFTFLKRIPYPRPFWLIALLFGLHCFGVLVWLVPLNTTQSLPPKLSGITGYAIDNAGAVIVLDDTGKVLQDSTRVMQILPSGVWAFLFLACMGLLLLNWFFPDFQLKPLHWHFEALLAGAFLFLWWHFDRAHQLRWFPWAILQGGGIIFIAYRMAHSRSLIR